MTAKNKAQRIKSETIHLDYISPWRSPQQSGRQLELLINKHKILEEIGSPKTPKAVWWHTQSTAQGNLRSDSPKKTARTCVKTVADCQREMQKTYHSNLCAKSQPLRNSSCARRLREIDHIIFAKKSKPTQKPKLVSLGSESTSPEKAKPKEERMFKRDNRPQSSHHSSQFNSNKKKFMLKKQSFTCNFLKGQINNHKEFISSLQSCLIQVEGTANHSQTYQLTKTLKNFLTHYKKR